MTMRMTTRSTCMQGASPRAIPTMHHHLCCRHHEAASHQKKPQGVITKVGKASRTLKEAAADIGAVMNESKEEHQAGFVGSGSVTSTRTLYKGGSWPEDMGKLCPTRRILGTLLAYNCSNVAERRSPPSGTSWVDGHGTFSECRVFLAGPPVPFFRSMIWSTL